MIIEDAHDAEAAVTGQIVAVLYTDTVKKFKKMDGVWPRDFLTETDDGYRRDASDTDDGRGPGSSDDEQNDDDDGDDDAMASMLHRLDIQDSIHDEDRNGTTVPDSTHDERRDGDDESGSESDDELPPWLEKIQNRKIIEYEISDSDSE